MYSNGSRVSNGPLCIDTSVPQGVLHAESLDVSQSASNVQSVGAITYTQ